MLPKAAGSRESTMKIWPSCTRGEVLRPSMETLGFRESGGEDKVGDTEGLQQVAVMVGTEGGVCVREDPKGDWQTRKATGFRDREGGALNL